MRSGNRWSPSFQNARRRSYGRSYPPLHGRHKERLFISLWRFGESSIQSRVQANRNIHFGQRAWNIFDRCELAIDRKGWRRLMVAVWQRKN